jgi:probable rRNA maturation factor
VNPRILIARSTRRARISAAGARALAAFFLSRAGPNAAGLDLLSIAFVDDAEMTRLNERFLRHEGPTDVISFRLAPAPGVSTGAADVIVNAEQALREARRRRGRPARELAWYLAHGIHHLAGADDRTPARRAAMHRIERRWLAAAARRGLLDNLLDQRP